MKFKKLLLFFLCAFGCMNVVQASFFTNPLTHLVNAVKQSGGNYLVDGVLRGVRSKGIIVKKDSLQTIWSNLREPGVVTVNNDFDVEKFKELLGSNEVSDAVVSSIDELYILGSSLEKETKYIQKGRTLTALCSRIFSLKLTTEDATRINTLLDKFSQIQDYDVDCNFDDQLDYSDDESSIYEDDLLEAGQDNVDRSAGDEDLENADDSDDENIEYFDTDENGYSLVSVPVNVEDAVSGDDGTTLEIGVPEHDQHDSLLQHVRRTSLSGDEDDRDETMSMTSSASADNPPAERKWYKRVGQEITDFYHQHPRLVKGAGAALIAGASATAFVMSNEARKQETKRLTRKALEVGRREGFRALASVRRLIDKLI